MRLEFLALALLAPICQMDLSAQVEASSPVVPVVGKAAPTLRLNDHTGKAVRIGGESETWTVLAFYPRAGTAG